MIKILIIGYGEIAQRHYKNIKFLIPKAKFLFYLKRKKKVQIIQILQTQFKMLKTLDQKLL